MEKWEAFKYVAEFIGILFMAGRGGERAYDKIKERIVKLEKSFEAALSGIDDSVRKSLEDMHAHVRKVEKEMRVLGYHVGMTDADRETTNPEIVVSRKDR